MAIYQQRAFSFLRDLLGSRSQEEIGRRLEPRHGDPAPSIPRSAENTPEIIERRWSVIGGTPEVKQALLDPQTESCVSEFGRNIENLIGTVKVPVGIAGPLRINGLHAHGDFYVPLATTEAALVASYSRGSRLVTDAGGCTAVLLNEGVSRAPAFAFRDLRDSGGFLVWLTSQFDELARVAESTTRHGKLIDIRITLEGNHVYLDFQFTVGDAAGQNMVTIATQALVEHIEKHSPVPVDYYFVEANMSGDKKACTQSFQGVRGKKACAEVHLGAELIEKHLHTTPERMVEYWTMAAIGGVLSGIVGLHGHYANGLAAIYLACGQDAACVAESAVGLTRFERTTDGGLYASVTLPGLIVGTVGGGTGLPSQRACLEILGLAGPGKARAFAEVCVAMALAGELSIIGALCAGHFTRAHQTLARKPKAE
jgi:hydroxymethylglutaryl-CoA reductase (NADPH)